MGYSVLVPPESLRLGIGPFADGQAFLESGRETVRLAERISQLRPDQSLLDVGCGCGRIALALQSFLSATGSYVGFDLNKSCIDWCTFNISMQDRRFTFLHYDLLSSSYNPNGSVPPAILEFPQREQFDLVIMSAVITHMYPEEIENYVRNLRVSLATNGRALISALLMNQEGRDAVKSRSTIFDFTHRVGDTCWTFDPARPLDGISCDLDWFLNLLNFNGFEVETLEYGTWRECINYDVQHDLLSIRRAA
jgi:SAM-dependent methyltransferase